MSTTSCGINENGTLTKDRSKVGHIGDIIAFYGSTAPEGTLVCNGAAISRTTYSELFGVIGTTAGAGDGSTTFNLPDLRGLFLRGLNGTNAAALGVEQGDATRRIYASFSFRMASDGTQLVFQHSGGGGGCATVVPWTSKNHPVTLNQSDPYMHNSDVRIDTEGYIPTANENRPVNTAVLYCMIYE